MTRELMDYDEYKYECGCPMQSSGADEIDGEEVFVMIPECPLHGMPIPLRVLADMKKGCTEMGIIDRSGMQ